MRTLRILLAFSLAAVSAAPAGAQQRGGTSVTGTASNNYANSGMKGDLTLEALSAMPREVAPFPVALKPNARFFAGRKRVYVPSYALMITRSGEASAYSGGGFTSDTVARRSTIETTLAGVPDELGVQLAGEAHADLVAKLKDAGYEVITGTLPGTPAPIGATAKSATGQVVYSPAGMPLVPGLPTVNFNLMPFNAVVGRNNPNGDDIIVLLPGMGIDYEHLASSGSHSFGSSADVGANLRFHIVANSGAMALTHSPAPYNSAWNSSFLVQNGAGTDEPFAILVQTGDKSDSKVLAVGLALAGMGNMYRQKKIYEAKADPGRFAALTRAGFQGMNASIVEQLKIAAASNK